MLCVASVAYLNSTGALRLGDFTAGTSQARTQSPAQIGSQGGGRVELSPTPASGTPAQRAAGLVRPDAIDVLIQQFGSLNDQPPLGLKAWIRIKDATVISRLVRELNALKPFPGGIYCPFDDGSYFALAFTYARGASASVKLEAGGCGEVFVGGSAQPVAWTLTSPTFLDTLRHHLAHPPASKN